MLKSDLEVQETGLWFTEHLSRTQVAQLIVTKFITSCVLNCSRFVVLHKSNLNLSLTFCGKMKYFIMVLNDTIKGCFVCHRQPFPPQLNIHEQGLCKGSLRPPTIMWKWLKVTNILSYRHGLPGILFYKDRPPENDVNLHV
jgi:hypothetical protein